MGEHGIIARRELKYKHKGLNGGVEGHFKLTDLNARDEVSRRSDERKRGLSLERKLGFEYGLRRNNESPDMCDHGIGDLGEASEA